MEKEIWAIITVIKPCESPNVIKSRKSDTPVMISGFRIGILFTKRRIFPVRLFKLYNPIAAKVPIRVDIEALIRAIDSVFQIVSVNEEFTPPLKSDE